MRLQRSSHFYRDCSSRTCVGGDIAYSIQQYVHTLVYPFMLTYVRVRAHLYVCLYA